MYSVYQTLRVENDVCFVRADLSSALCAVSNLSLRLIPEESLFSTVMFIFALHAQNMYKTTENKKQSYEQSVNPYLYLLIIIKK